MKTINTLLQHVPIQKGDIFGTKYLRMDQVKFVGDSL